MSRTDDVSSAFIASSLVSGILGLTSFQDYEPIQIGFASADTIFIITKALRTIPSMQEPLESIALAFRPQSMYVPTTLKCDSKCCVSF